MQEDLQECLIFKAERLFIFKQDVLSVFCVPRYFHIYYLI